MSAIRSTAFTGLVGTCCHIFCPLFVIGLAVYKTTIADIRRSGHIVSLRQVSAKPSPTVKELFQAFPMDALHLLLALTILLIFFVWIVRFIGNYYGLSAHRPEESSLVVKKWDKDVVYLVKYADNNYCINASPFCLKLEFFLRYHKIVYKVGAIESYEWIWREKHSDFDEFLAELGYDS
uniref:Glutaredoxin domain-containing protein n=1 Tax=Bursaphelenchus xylophilus TaxID=6326 RepID=A0A1I7SEZ4_BURXY